MQWFNHYLKGPGGAMPSAEIDYTGSVGEEDRHADRERQPLTTGTRVEHLVDDRRRESHVMLPPALIVEGR